MEVSDEIQAPAALFPAPTEYEASVDFFFCRRDKSLAPARIRAPKRPASSLVTILTELSRFLSRRILLRISLLKPSNNEKQLSSGLCPSSQK